MAMSTESESSRVEDTVKELGSGTRPADVPDNRWSEVGAYLQHGDMTSGVLHALHIS